MSSTTELLYQEDGARGDALPAELLPCAAALLLPLLLLPPERVRALDLQRPSRRGGDDRLSVFLSGVLVRPRPPPPRRRPAVLCATAQTAGTQRAPGCAGAQTACRALVADDSTGECRALVPACAGLVPFVVQALRTLADEWLGSCWMNGGWRACRCMPRAACRTAVCVPHMCACSKGVLCERVEPRPRL